MRKELIPIIEMILIVAGVMFAYFGGIVLESDLILSGILLMVGIGFLCFRIEYVKEKE